MYKRILLAYDGSVEGRTALREGALLALRCRAKVFLLSVVVDTAGLRLAEGVYPGPVAHAEDDLIGVLEDGEARLRRLGFNPVAKLVRGEPAEEIGAFAEEVGADLIVVGHHRQSTFERWWSGHSGAYLMDHTRCSLMIARNYISDEVFRAALAALETSG